MLGLFVQNGWRFNCQRSWGAEPLLEDVRCCAIAQNEPGWGFCETKPIPGCAIRGDVLTSGISLAGVTIAGFGVAFGLALVSVAYE